MSELNKNEIIAELRDISATLNKKASLQGKLSSILSDFDCKKDENVKESAARLVKFQEEQDMPKSYPKHGASELKADISEVEAIEGMTAGKIIFASLSGFILIGFFALFVILSAVGATDGFLYTLAMLGTLAFAAVWFVFGAKSLDAVINFNKKEEAYQDGLLKIEAMADGINSDAFFAEWAKLDGEFKGFVETCKKEHDRELLILMERENEFREKILAEADVIEADIGALDAHLKTKNVIHPDLFYLAGNISEILEYGRADSLKEAINIALSDERHDEEENERRREAARQEAILEEQAEAEAAHNREMQRIAEREARESQRAREESARREKQAADERERRERQAQSERERARRSRCNSCINSSKCSYSAKQADSCGGYVPR